MHIEPQNNCQYTKTVERGDITERKPSNTLDMWRRKKSFWSGFKLYIRLVNLKLSLKNNSLLTTNCHMAAIALVDPGSSELSRYELNCI